jgi:hypothetical protein
MEWHTHPFLCSRLRSLFRLLVIGPLSICCGLTSAVASERKPRIRTITAFVRIDSSQYRQQLEEAVTVLRQAKTALERGGYEVQQSAYNPAVHPIYRQPIRSGGVSSDESSRVSGPIFSMNDSRSRRVYQSGSLVIGRRLLSGNCRALPRCLRCNMSLAI